MINKLIVDGQNITLNESSVLPFTYSFSKAGVHTVRVGLDQTNEVCAYAFKDCSDLTKVTFPSKIENIKRYAFENCTSLKSVNLPDTIKYVGPSVFDGCISLSEINFEHTTPPQFFSNLTAGTNCYVPDGHKFVLAEGELVKDGSVQYYEKNSLGGYDAIDYEGLVDGEEYYYDVWTDIHNSENIIEQRFKIRPTQIDFMDEDDVATEYPNVEQGTTSQLFNIRFTPENTTNKNVIYLSSNEGLVTVSQTGEITTRKHGTGRATIYCITEPYYDGSYVSASLRIRVVDNSSALTMSLSFGNETSKNYSDMNIGDTIVVPTAILTGDDSLVDPVINYSSSNTNIIDFENNEWVIKGEGTANIVASYDGDDDHKPAEAIYKVTIALHIEKKVMTLGFAHDVLNENLKVGDQIVLQEAILSGDNTLQNPVINYEVIDDNEVLNIGDNDDITVAKEGTVTVRATYAGDTYHLSAEAEYTINITIKEDQQELFYLGSTKPTLENLESLNTVEIKEWTQENPYQLDMTSLVGETQMFLMLPNTINSNNIRILDSQNNNMGIAINSELVVDEITYNIYDVLLGQGIYRFFVL